MDKFRLWSQITQNSRNPVKNRLNILKDKFIINQIILIWFDGNIGGKHNLNRKPTFSELANGEFSTLISNFYIFKEPGQNPFKYF